jgi:hypothetical protein
MAKTIGVFIRKAAFIRPYIIPITCILVEKYQYKILILHTSTLEEDQTDTNLGSDYELYDISNSSVKTVKQIIANHKPSIFLITNFRSLLDIVFIRLFNSINTPVVYFEHGFVLEKALKFKKNGIKSAIRYLNYFSKSLQLALNSSAMVSELRLILRAFLKNDYSQLKINFFVLYTNHTYTILSKIFTKGGDKIIYSGYPICKSSSELSALKKIEKTRQIVFIHQPLIADNYSTLTYEQEAAIFIEMKAIAEGYGYEFILKLHPRDDAGSYRSRLPGVTIYEQQNTNETIAASEIVVGLFSTALFTAVVLGRHLMIMDFGDLKISALNEFKQIGREFKSLKEFGSVVNEISSNKDGNEKYEKFRNDYIGDNNDFEHRADSINNIVTGL